MFKKLTVLITLAVILTFSTGLFQMLYAEPPKLIGFQGRLTDAKGKAVTGTKAITFKIFDVATEGTALWTETQSVTLDSNGLYDVHLGEVTALDLAFDIDYWLEVKIGDEILSPRYKLVSTAYSFYSLKCTSATYAETSGSTVDTEGLLSKSGGTMTGDINLSSNSIIGAYKVIASTVGTSSTIYYGNGSHLTGLGSGGNMNTAVYDTDVDGVVDNSAAISGKTYAAFVSTSGAQIITGDVTVNGTINISTAIRHYSIPGNSICSTVVKSSSTGYAYMDVSMGGSGCYPVFLPQGAVISSFTVVTSITSGTDGAFIDIKLMKSDLSAGTPTVMASYYDDTEDGDIDTYQTTSIASPVINNESNFYYVGATIKNTDTGWCKISGIVITYIITKPLP
ncbi:MAG: hypothetical protein JW871_01620 [Endomicrobiales bacterium]|nr:hypothetical protein [Endomicrobiales bacterium]